MARSEITSLGIVSVCMQSFPLVSARRAGGALVRRRDDLQVRDDDKRSPPATEANFRRSALPDAGGPTAFEEGDGAGRLNALDREQAKLRPDPAARREAPRCPRGRAARRAGPAIREHPGTRAVRARAPPTRSPRAAGRPPRPGRPTRSRRRRSASRRAGSRGPSRRPLPPLSDLSGVLPVVSGAGAVERVAGAPARREVRLRERRGGADEIPMAEIQLRQDVGGLHARLALDEARVPRIEVIIRPGRVGRFAPGDVSERRDHRLVPAGDVNQDLADAPAPEPHAAHLLVGQALDRLTKLGERFLSLPPPPALFAPRFPPGPRWWLRLLRPRPGPRVK